MIYKRRDKTVLIKQDVFCFDAAELYVYKPFCMIVDSVCNDCRFRLWPNGTSENNICLRKYCVKK